MHLPVDGRVKVDVGLWTCWSLIPSRNGKEKAQNWIFFPTKKDNKCFLKEKKKKVDRCITYPNSFLISEIPIYSGWTLVKAPKAILWMQPFYLSNLIYHHKLQGLSYPQFIQCSASASNLENHRWTLMSNPLHSPSILSIS